MSEINGQIAQLHEEWRTILDDYSPATYNGKRGRLHDLEERMKALYARKRATLAAQRKARNV